MPLLVPLEWRKVIEEHAMARGAFTLALRHIRKLAGVEPSEVLSDGALLERFADKGDQEAFALLMDRHGTLVLDVCQRVLGNAHHAEDAFQATFLVLVRKARSLAGQHTVAGWLHTVAFHLALRVRAREAHRRTAEREVSQMPKH